MCTQGFLSSKACRVMGHGSICFPESHDGLCSLKLTTVPPASCDLLTLWPTGTLASKRWGLCSLPLELGQICNQSMWHALTFKHRDKTDSTCFSWDIHLWKVCPSTWSECPEAVAQSSPHTETLRRGPETTGRERSLPCPHHTHRPASPCPQLFQLHRLTAAKTLPEPASESPAKLPQIPDPQKPCNYGKSFSLGGSFFRHKTKKNTTMHWKKEDLCYVVVGNVVCSHVKSFT